jgi:hypothetical protein
LGKPIAAAMESGAHSGAILSAIRETQRLFVFVNAEPPPHAAVYIYLVANHRHQSGPNEMAKLRHAPPPWTACCLEQWLCHLEELREKIVFI